jgi:hypothetical protein
MEEIKVLESKQLDEAGDVFFLKINYLGKEYVDTISISGLELALISLPEEKKPLHLAFQQALKQIKEPEPKKEPKKSKKYYLNTEGDLKEETESENE